MKRFVSFAIAIIMMLALCACGAQEESKSATAFQIGYGRAKIMPEGPVNLSGGGNPNRISDTVLDILYVTCIAITDAEGETMLLFTQDLQSVVPSSSDPVLKEVSRETGVPLENMILAATHTHSAPAPYEGRTGYKEWQPIYHSGVVQAAKDAMKDRSPATISIGSADATGYTFVRNYVLENGTYAGANYGDFGSSPIKGYTYDGDTEMQMIRFEREGKKAVLLMNLGTHATFNGSTSLLNLSADFPFYMRDYVEKNSDVLTAYFMAAAGDQAPTSRIAEDDRKLDYKGYGEAVGKLIVDKLPEMKAVQPGPIQIARQVITADTNRHSLDRLAEAQETYNAYLQGGYPMSDPLVAKYGFVRVFEARAIVQNSALEDTKDVQLNAMSIGDISFVFAPYEMFCQSGRYIKDNSPFAMTFVATIADEPSGVAPSGYIPTEIGYDVYCYEAYSSHFVRGTAETLDKTYVSMLNELKGNSENSSS